jgi:hypothetical protein
MADDCWELPSVQHSPRDLRLLRFRVAATGRSMKSVMKPARLIGPPNGDSSLTSHSKAPAVTAAERMIIITTRFG